MADRIFAIIILLIAVNYGYSAIGIREGFMSDPLGPKAFPFMLTAITIVCALVVLVKPSDTSEESWPDAIGFLRVFGLSAILFLYALALKPFGFLIPTFLVSAAISYLIFPKMQTALLTGVGLSLGLFALFKLVLNLSLSAFGHGI